MPARHPWRIVGGAFALIVVVAVVNSVLGNPRWGWDVFAEWFFAEPVLVGLGRTLLLTVLGAFFGFTIGALLALARLSGSAPLAGVSWTFVWLFRSIPLIVLLFDPQQSRLSLRDRLAGRALHGMELLLLSDDTAHQPLYGGGAGPDAEPGCLLGRVHPRRSAVGRSGVSIEAAAALGLPRQRQFFRIVLPQAMRSILPTAFNDIIGLAKGTSNVYILALPSCSTPSR